MHWDCVLFSFLLMLSLSLSNDEKLDDASILYQRRNYLQYTECIREQEKRDRISAEVIIARPGSDLTLPCFSCLSPEQMLEIESVWKPSASMISKRTKNKIVDSVKNFVFRDSGKPPKQENWKFEWEFQSPGTSNWIPLTRNHKKRSILAKALSLVMAFAGRNKKHRVSVGDRYELIMSNVSLRGPGFYRCVNKYDNLNLVSSLFYLDPVMTPRKSERTVYRKHKMYFFEKTLEESLEDDLNAAPVTYPDPAMVRTAKQQIASLNPGNGLSVVYETSPWSLCSSCTHNTTKKDSPGERRRTHECFVKRTGNVHTLDAESSIFKIFDTIPCRSSLLPPSIKKQIATVKRLVIHEVEMCLSVCLLRPPKSRILTKLDNFGVTKVLDYLPVGEYLLSEVLPPLRRPVKRKSIALYEGDPLTLSCGLLPHEMIGSRWSVDGLNLTHFSLKEFFGNRTSVIDERGDLSVRSLALDDKAKYSCHSDEGDLLAAYSVNVMLNDRTQQIIENVKMAVRFAAFLLIFLLIVKQVAG